MADNVLESYLVKLGASVDANSFNKFNSTLKDSDKLVSSFSLSTIGYFGKMEVAIVGMFAAVGSGIIALADKTAMADQQYRLFGLRMLMGKDSARAMSMATDELGASLDEIAYDPELNKRFQALYEQNIKLGKSMGADFDKNMRSIRDLRMEYKRFDTELDFLTMGSVSKLFEKLGFGSGDLLNDLERFNNWFSDQLPKMADQVSTQLVPVWNDFAVVMKDSESSLKTFGGDFTYLSGVLLGDKSIQSTEFSVKNLVTALDDWADRLTKISLGFQVMGRIAMHTITGITAVLGEAYAQATNDKDAAPFRQKASDEATALVHDLHGLFDSKYRTGDDFAGFRQQAGEGSKQGAANPTTAATARQLAQRVSGDTGIPADLIYAQWAHETGNFTNRGAHSLNNLAGMRVPGTTEYQNFKSLDGFAASYEKLIESSRYTSEGINQAKTADQFAHALKMGHYYEDSEANYANGMRGFQRDYQGGSRGSGDTNIQSITINVPPGTHPDDIKRYITDSMTDYTAKVNQRVMSQTAAGAYY